MTKSLNKISKKISKKKGSTTSLHTNSRDSQRLRRASGREDNLARLAQARKRINSRYLERVVFFQGVANAAEAPFQPEQCHKAITSRIGRDDEELAKLETERRPGRPTSSYYDRLTQRKNSEEVEYEAGFWLPDLADESNLKKLRLWDGTWASLATINFVRMSVNGGLVESTFPPKGLS